MSSNGSTNNQPPPSPWKKPKTMSLSRTKSLKRKSDIFGTSGVNLENNPGLAENETSAKSAKIGKNIFNRFSINNTLNNYSFENNKKSVDLQALTEVPLKINFLIQYEFKIFKMNIKEK